MKKFIEENSKWIVWVLVLIGLFLILKLFYFGVDTHCGSFCIVPTIDYYWTNASTIAFLLITIAGFLILFIGDSEKSKTKIKFAIIILILGSLGKPLFYLFSPDFRFYNIGEYKYTDKNGNLTDIDLYLDGMKKYCNNSVDDFKFKRVYREDMCAGQYVIDLNTVEEYAKVFDFANKNNLRHLYKLTFNGAKDFGIEKIIEGYSDDTFYGYIIDWYWENKELLNIIGQNTNNIKITDLVKFINIEVLKGNELEGKFKDGEFRIYWDEFNFNLKQKLKEIPEINKKIFYN